MFLTWFKQPRNSLVTVAGCRPSNGNKVCLVLRCPRFVEWQRGRNVILGSVQAWICRGWGRREGEKTSLACGFIVLGVKCLLAPVWDSCQCVAYSGWTWRKFSFFSVTASGLKSWVIDSLFIYQERKKNESETPSSGQWIRRQGTQFILDRSERKKHLKSYSSWTKDRPSQPPHALSQGLSQSN